CRSSLSREHPSYLPRPRPSGPSAASCSAETAAPSWAASICSNSSALSRSPRSACFSLFLACRFAFWSDDECFLSIPPSCLRFWSMAGTGGEHDSSPSSPDAGQLFRHNRQELDLARLCQGLTMVTRCLGFPDQA